MSQPFIMAFLRNPRQIGSLIPSSERLAQAMVADIDPESDSVLELGPGTGVITHALLEKGLPPEKLWLVEKEPTLAARLNKQFPSVTTLCQDASRLILDECLTNQPISCVVSSLPLLNIRPFNRLKILQQVFQLLGDSGRLIQFTYSLKPPISQAMADNLGVRGERKTTVLRNLPPASVWQYRRVSTLID